MTLARTLAAVTCLCIGAPARANPESRALTEQARRHYRLAIELAERGNDPNGKAEAQSLLSRAR